MEERDVDAARQRAIARLAVVSLDGTLKGWDATFAASAVAQHERNGSLSDAQWKHVLRIARMAPLVRRAPAPTRTESEREMDEVEAQLDALLALPMERGGERCLLTVQEAHGRAERIARVLGVQDGDDRASERLDGRFAVCGTCTIGPARACARCARGEPHPGEPCDDPRRNRCCKGVALYAHLTAKIRDARGDHATAQEIREDMGLAQPAAPASTGAGGATAGEVKA